MVPTNLGAKIMNEKAIKDAMRLYAVEFFVATLFAVHCVNLDPSDPLKPLERAKKGMIEGAQKNTFSGQDPAMSDHLSAELEAAVTRLLAMAHAKITVQKFQG
jgi:hypothetical protein